MASVSIGVEYDEQVSRVHRVSRVGVTDGSSLTGMSVVAAAGLGLFVQGRIVLVFLFVVAVFHRWYINASWSSFFAYTGEEEGGTGSVRLAILGRKNWSCLRLA